MEQISLSDLKKINNYVVEENNGDSTEYKTVNTNGSQAKANIAIENSFTTNDNKEAEYDIEDDNNVNNTKEDCSYENDEDDIDNDDIDNEDETDIEKKDNSVLNNKDFKNDVLKKTSTIKNKINLNEFKVSKRPRAINNVLKRVSNKNERVIDWVLYNTKTSISLSEFTADDLLQMNINSNRNRINHLTDKFTVIFNHLKDINKPETMEEWLKSVYYHDINHLYMAVYKASFNDANYIPYECPHCKKPFLSDDMPIDNMIKFNDNKVKKEFYDIYNYKVKRDDEFTVDIYRKQINDNIVIDFKMPTLYEVFFETNLLDEDFVSKNKTLLTYTNYIDSIYYINYETKELDLIEFPIYDNNIVKNIQSRAKTIFKVLRTFNSDELARVDVIIDELDDKYETIEYVLPEISCKHCKKTIQEVKVEDTEQLIFLRRRLPHIATS